MDEYTRDIIEDLRDDVAARADGKTATERAITCCHPGMVAVLNHIDSLTVRLKESEDKLDTYKSALDKIACWGESEFYDEPGSVRIAREALK
jgi:hypothetical protein